MFAYKTLVAALCSKSHKIAAKLFASSYQKLKSKVEGSKKSNLDREMEVSGTTSGVQERLNRAKNRARLHFCRHNTMVPW